jgi:hypothetical protein
LDVHNIGIDLYLGLVDEHDSILLSDIGDLIKFKSLLVPFCPLIARSDVHTLRYSWYPSHEVSERYLSQQIQVKMTARPNLVIPAFSAI